MTQANFRPFDLSNPANWQRVDESADSVFYQPPRLVVHVDDHFIQTLTDYYRQHLQEGMKVLDMMSSYKSHLPGGVKFGHVSGQGMNKTELEANDQLDDFIIQDLNLNPHLPYDDNSFDAVLNTVSVQYLKRPVEVFREVGRVLKPGGQFIVSFSNRMFPTKAVAIWRENDDMGHLALVMQYFAESGRFDEPDLFQDVAKGSNWFFNSKDPVYILNGVKKSS